MQKPTLATLLVGSPKGPNSTSNCLGTYLLERLQKNGVVTEKAYISRSLSSDKNRAEMLRLVDRSSLIILACPLYVDSLNAQTIEALELIAEHRKTRTDIGGKSFAVIINSGFPEAKQNNTAISVCHLFAKQVDFNWAGGLAMGAGAIIDGQPLAEIGVRARNQKRALEIAADALALEEPIPEKAIVLMSKLGIPKWLYLLIANQSGKHEAKKLGVTNKLYDQPYKPKKKANS
jgi:hypothetical protein